MEGRKKDCPDSRRELRKTAMLGLLVVSAAAVGAAGLNLTEVKAQKAQRTISDTLHIVNRRCEFAELNPLREEKYSELTDVVEGYYRKLGEDASFVESYDDVRAYAKEGRYQGTYVVFARYNMKIRGIYTKVPGLGTLYVAESGEGGFRVSASVEDERVKDCIRRLAEHGDVQALMAETQEAYQAAVRSDALLQEALSDLKNAYEED